MALLYQGESFCFECSSKRALYCTSQPETTCWSNWSCVSSCCCVLVGGFDCSWPHLGEYAIVALLLLFVPDWYLPGGAGGEQLVRQDSRFALLRLLQAGNDGDVEVREGDFPPLVTYLFFSTDNPRAIHLTPEPLLEEYAVAVQTWRLRSADQAELARNSVLLSGFSDKDKTSWLGPKFYLANDPFKSGIPQIRAQYRSECLADERAFVLDVSSDSRPNTFFSFPNHTF